MASKLIKVSDTQYRIECESEEWIHELTWNEDKHRIDLKDYATGKKKETPAPDSPPPPKPKKKCNLFGGEFDLEEDE